MPEETIPADIAPVVAPTPVAEAPATAPTLAEVLADNAILKAQIADLQTKLALARRG